VLKRIILLYALVLFSFGLASAQSTVTKDPNALSLLSAAVSALASGTSISNVTLTGTVTRTAGSDVETGSVTLEAFGGVDSRINLALTNGQRSEIINQSQGAPVGQYSGPDSTVHLMAVHNCWIPASWFFPALALAEALNDPAVTITYIGQETRNGEAVQHVRFSRVLPGENGTAEALAQFRALSAADVYLDAANSLPVELDFNLHPDKNASVDIPAEVRYSGYQKVGGILLPTHIQKLINHSLYLDLNVTGAAINANLSSADFAITATGK